MWDARSGNMIKEILGVHLGQISGVLYIPGKNAILTTSRDDSLKLIDIRTNEIMFTCTHNQFKVGLNWSKSCESPDGQYFASGSSDGSIHFWNAYTGAHDSSLRGNGTTVSGVAWGYDYVYSSEKKVVCCFGRE